MAIDPVFNPDVLTSEERWRRWEQRGRDNDARFMRQMRYVCWFGVALAGLLVFSC